MYTSANFISREVAQSYWKQKTFHIQMYIVRILMIFIHYISTYNVFVIWFPRVFRKIIELKHNGNNKTNRWLWHISWFIALHVRINELLCHTIVNKCVLLRKCIILHNNHHHNSKRKNLSFSRRLDGHVHIFFSNHLVRKFLSYFHYLVV